MSLMSTSIKSSHTTSYYLLIVTATYNATFRRYGGVRVNAETHRRPFNAFANGGILLGD